MSSTAARTPSAPVWVEYTHDLCNQLNCNKCIVLVGDASIIKPVTSLVDEACRHCAVTTAFTKTANGSVSCAFADMPHVTFTTAANQRMAQKCMAVFGRVPFLAIVDMRDDGDEHSFVIELNGKIGTNVDTLHLTKTIVEFLTRVGRGVEPRCPQGAAPPLKDIFAPTHGAVLCEARAAVTSTFSRLVHTVGASSAPCGALCVFWSDRCPCCPGVLMLIEAMVRLVRLVAARHAGHPSGDVSFTFPFLVANIDENDFTETEWPVAQREQVVPSLVAYPAPSYKPVLFRGERLPLRLAAFICTHCLPSADLVACTPHIMEEVAKVAAQLSIDALMTVMDEDSEGYAKATQAYDIFENAASSAETEREVEELFATFQEVRTAALPFSLEMEVQRISAEGGAAASGSFGESLVNTEDGGEEADENDDVAETKSAAAAAASGVLAVTTTTAATTATAPGVVGSGTGAAPVVVNAYKRPRE